MPDQHIPDLQRDRLHSDIAGRYCPQRFLSRHTVCAGRNLDRAMLRGDTLQAKADDQQIRGQGKVRSFGEQRTLIVDMCGVVFGVVERHIAAPLIGDDSIVHNAPRDTEHFVVEEEVRCKAGWIKGHRKKVAMRAAVRLVGLEPGEEHRPKRVTACIDQRRREMFSEYAIAFIADVHDIVVAATPVPVIHQSRRPGRFRCQPNFFSASDA